MATFGQGGCLGTCKTPNGYFRRVSVRYLVKMGTTNFRLLNSSKVSANKNSFSKLIKTIFSILWFFLHKIVFLLPSLNCVDHSKICEKFHFLTELGVLVTFYDIFYQNLIWRKGHKNVGRGSRECLQLWLMEKCQVFMETIFMSQLSIGMNL